MQVSRNEWTPLFEKIRTQLNPESRTELLMQIIYELRAITIKNFGSDGIDRPKAWKVLRDKYASQWKYGDTTPTLQMSDEKHNLRNKGLPHLIQMFRVTASDNQATLTNDSPYADTHQKGLGVPERPYYPVIFDDLTPMAKRKVFEIVEKHFQG